MKKFILLLLIFNFSCAYAEPQIDFDDGIYHIVLNDKKAAKYIDFVTVNERETNKKIHQINDTA